MAGMTNAHRMFLQGFLSRGILQAKEVKKLYSSCVSLHPNEEEENPSLAELVEAINANVKPMWLEIRKAICDDTGAHFYGLVNLTKSDVTLLSSDYNVFEYEIFKKIIEEVVEAESGQVSSITVLNMTDIVKDKKILKKDIEALLARLERDKWITVKSGNVQLSTRTILELEQYIKAQYPDLTVNCNMCNRLCIRGESCSQCDVKMHFHCSNTYFKGQGTKCPNRQCGALWPHAHGTQKGNDTAESSGTEDVRPPARKRRSVHMDTE